VDLRFLSGRINIESVESSPSPSPRIRFLAAVNGESGCARIEDERKGLGEPGGDFFVVYLRVGDGKRFGKEGKLFERSGLAGWATVVLFTGEKGLGRAEGGNGSLSFSVGLECTMIGLEGTGALLVIDCCC
jgi:hypothetical protein